MNKLIFCRRIIFTTSLAFFCLLTYGQNQTVIESSDPLSYGVILDDPAMKNVIVTKDIPYMTDGQGSLKMDIYSPPQLRDQEKRPVIVFLNAIGERPGQRKVKTWGIYSSWPKLVAAHGFIGVSMETDGSRIQESISGLFDFLSRNKQAYHIDAEKMGVYAASANVTQSLNYLMSDKVFRGIRAAALYYGGMPHGPFRRDLPVLFIVSEGDVARNGYTGLWNEVLKNNAPWTIRMATDMPHAFDAYSDNEDARKIVKETISFWKNQLDPVPAPGFPHSRMRDVFGLLRMNPAKALELLKSVTEQHPDDMVIQLLYADALRESGKIDESVPVYQRILVKDPDNVQAEISLGLIYYSKGNTEEAQKLIAKADQSGKMSGEAYGSLGLALLISGKNREAALYYEKALRLRSNGNDYYNLACAYAKEGEKELAFQALSKSFESGIVTKQLLENDADLSSLRSDTRYKQILEKAP